MPPTSPTPVNRDEAPVRERGDACPGALRLHAADDGWLARLRLPAGLLTHHQASEIAAAAERLGDGHLDITSRGNIQLRGLAESCGGELALLLHEAGLLPSEEHERVRNIVASPLGGLDGLGSGDVRLWATELDRLLCASPAATALSGRFLFALDDGRGDVAALGADVTLIAEPGATAALHTGTGRSVLRVAAAEGPRAALLAAETFLTVAAEAGLGPVLISSAGEGAATPRGNSRQALGAWRVRELPAGHGLDRAVAAALSRADIGAELLVDAPPGPEGGAPAPGTVRSPDGTVALSVYAPLGRLSVAQWRMLLATGTGLRITPWRGVIVPGLDPAAAGGLLRRLTVAGLITTSAAPLHRVGACTGRPGCGKSLADVRADAAGTPDAGPGGLPVYWAGCARRCGRPGGDHVDVVANPDGGYDITVSVRGTSPATVRTPAAGPELTGAVATARHTTAARAISPGAQTPVTR